MNRQHTSNAARQPSESGHSKTTPVPLYWVRHGPRGADPLLVLHGGPGAHHDYLLPQMLELARKREVVFYDQRGGGASRDDSREEITWETQVADVARMATELRVLPLTLVGYSWGGLLALLYCIRAAQTTPQDLPPVKRLVLIDPAPVSRVHRDAMQQVFSERQNSESVAQLRKALIASGVRESNHEEYRKRLFELSVRGYFSDPDAARDLTPFRVTGRVQDSIWNSLGDYDFRGELGALDMPSLVVHGRDDPIPLQSSIEIADALRARLLVLERSGHVPYVEQPLGLFSAIESFLEEYPVK